MQSTCMHNFTIIASAVPEISLGASTTKVGHVTLTILMLGLDIAYMHAKFDNSSFSRSGDMVGAHQNLNGSCDPTTPLSAIVSHLWASTCYD